MYVKIFIITRLSFSLSVCSLKKILENKYNDFTTIFKILMTV